MALTLGICLQRESIRDFKTIWTSSIQAKEFLIQVPPATGLVAWDHWIEVQWAIVSNPQERIAEIPIEIPESLRTIQAWDWVTLMHPLFSSKNLDPNSFLSLQTDLKLICQMGNTIQINQTTIILKLLDLLLLPWVFLRKVSGLKMSQLVNLKMFCL